MKKIISLFAAFAMVSTIFASVAFAIPAKATLHLDINEADADQIEEYEEYINESIPSGYTLYVVSISQSGLGAFTNSNTKTSGTNLQKPKGFLPTMMTFKIDFDDDNFANIYDGGEDGDPVDYIYAVGNRFRFAVNYSSTYKTISAYYGPFENGGIIDYPLNPTTSASLAENATIVDLYLLVSAATVGTLDNGTLFNMVQMTGGSFTEITGGNVTNNEQAEYSIENRYLECNDAFELGDSGSGGGETLPGEAADEEKIVAKEAGSVSDLTDLDGNAVTSLSKNYGIAKFTQTISPASKDYYVYAKDTKGNTNINLTAGGEFATPEDKAFADSKFKINFGIEGIDTNGTVSFYALIHSTTHVIDTIRLIAVDKAE